MDRIKLMNSLLLSMPGSPVLYYGDEIGMGDNIFLGDRNGVRTPMQWSPDRNAGFSRADPQRLYLPPIMDPIYGFEAVNVEAQAREPSSLLNWTRRLLAVRKTSKAFGRGKLTFLRPGNRKILAYLREYGDDAILCVANLARSAQPVELDLARLRGRVPVELMGRAAFPPIGELPYLLTLPACGFYWFRLATDVPTPEWHEERLAREDLPVLVLFDGWSSFFRDRVVPWRIGMAQKVRTQLEDEVLPRYVESQRWYAAKGDRIVRSALRDHAEWKVGARSWLFTLVEVESAAGKASYSIPLTLAWDDGEEERTRALAPATLAKVRQQAAVGSLADALADEAFCRALVEAIGSNRELATAQGRLHFAPTRAFPALAGDQPGALAVTQSRAQSSNTTVGLGERLFLKLYRQLRAGVNPEVEMGRFLTEAAGFRNCVPVAGALEYAGSDGTAMTLALLQGYVANQGDGWTYALEYLEHFLDEHAERPAQALPADVHGAFLELTRTLGRRTAELHLALAGASGDPAFAPEPIAASDLSAWASEASTEAMQSLDRVERGRAGLPPALHEELDRLAAARQSLLARMRAAAEQRIEGLKIRHHGDYHLGQVLLSNNDFVIIDFEGEPARPLAQRRRKHSPLRDVAGMLRSFNYVRHTALLHVTEHRPDALAALAPLAGNWEKQVREGFLSAYAQYVEGSPLYGSFAAARPLLELFELEKAFYELRYELGHRPDWAGVPLRGILAYT